MRLKLFRAAGMAEAMAQVRTELGTDALILNTRKVAGGIEVTAAVEPRSDPIPQESDRVAALSWHGVPLSLHPLLARGDLEVAIADALRFGPIPLEPYERPVMLAGPPGAGKTLTTARLATRLVMSGIAPMVITTDGRRAGATEQLAAFTPPSERAAAGSEQLRKSEPSTDAKAGRSTRVDRYGWSRPTGSR